MQLGNRLLQEESLALLYFTTEEIKSVRFCHGRDRLKGNAIFVEKTSAHVYT